MGLTLKRKRCACGCGQWFSPDKAVRQFKNWEHFIASPQYKAQVRRAAPLAAQARKRNLSMRVPTLSGFGALTPREYAIYQRGRHNGAVNARRGRPVDAAYRRGWAEALGEHDGTPLRRKGRAA